MAKFDLTGPFTPINALGGTLILLVRRPSALLILIASQWLSGLVVDVFGPFSQLRADGDTLARLSGLVSLVALIAIQACCQVVVVKRLIWDAMDVEAGYDLAIRASLPTVGWVLLVGLLASLGLGVGFSLLVVPGLYFLCRWWVVVPATVEERTEAFPAFSRSRALTQGHKGAIFLALFVVLIIFIGLRSLVRALVAPDIFRRAHEIVAHGGPDAVFLEIYQPIQEGLFLAIGYALMAYTYCHLRVLKDAEPKEAAADPTAWTGRR